MTRHFSLRWQNNEYPRIFQVTGANQNAPKLLSTDLVNTKCHKKQTQFFFSVFISNEIEETDIFGTEYVVTYESSFSFKTSGEGTLTTCKKSNIFCEIVKGTVRLYDSRLQLSEETFCKIL